MYVHNFHLPRLFRQLSRAPKEGQLDGNHGIEQWNGFTFTGVFRNGGLMSTEGVLMEKCDCLICIRKPCFPATDGWIG